MQFLYFMVIKVAGQVVKDRHIIDKLTPVTEQICKLKV